ncbi:MAG: hypothetical protein IPM13_07945 [Phycisphaerales bacterium]|nr:hypothetical protein [Phycisphaerales bacterium]
MAREGFTYEKQARLSVLLAGVAGLGALAALGLVLRNFRADAGMTVYSGKGMWLPVLGLTLLFSFAAAGTGLFLGLNGAGQKRNTKSSLSWLGFFLSAGVITLAAIVGVFFAFTRVAM